jgi:NTE family protein
MIDGGVVNPVPITLCRALGAEIVIAVNLNVPVSNRWAALRRATSQPVEEPRDRQAEPAEASWAFMDKWAELMDGLVETLKPASSAGPGLFEVIAGSVHIMQDHIARSRMAGDPPNLAITPELGDFQLMDFHRAEEAIEAGRKAVVAMERQLEALVGGGQ